MTTAATLRTPGTRGLLLWTKENLPWVYAEFVRKGVSGSVTPGLSGYDFSAGGAYGLGDISTDPSGTTTFWGGDAGDTFNSNVTAAPTADPASSAPTSATPSSLSNILSSIATSVGAALLTKQQLNQQQTLFNAQLQQAQLGRPPLDLRNVQSLIQAGGPTVNFGLSSSAQGMLTWGLGIVGGLLLLNSVMGKRRAA